MTPEEEMAEWEWSRKANVVLDRFREHGWGPGMPVAEVQLLLRREWRSEFGTEIPDETLSGFAPHLADGHYFHVRPAPDEPTRTARRSACC